MMTSKLTCGKCYEVIQNKTPGKVFYRAEIMRLEVQEDTTTKITKWTPHNDPTMLHFCNKCGEKLAKLFGIYMIDIENNETVDFDNNKVWEQLD